MRAPRIVIDTNVIVSALRSRKGASYRLLRLIGTDRFSIAVSIPLILEYEHVIKQHLGNIIYSTSEIDIVLDYISAAAVHQRIFFLWRPFLADPKDDMVLELAVASQAAYIITYDLNHFRQVSEFGIRPMTAKEFLEEIGDIDEHH